MLSEKGNELYNFVINNLDNIEEEKTGRFFAKPEYELYPRDYLRFAESEIDIDSVKSKLNCISHLKRAVDCQVDFFFNIFGLGTRISKMNLKLEKKLEFISDLGIFNHRALVKLNRIRNKLEHHYEVPKIQDLDLYYDLCHAFVGNIESTISLMVWTEYHFNASNDDLESALNLEFVCDSENGSYFKYSDDYFGSDNYSVIKFNKDEIDDFILAFRILYLFNLSDSFIDRKYIKDNLQQFYERVKES